MIDPQHGHGLTCPLRPGKYATRTEKDLWSSQTKRKVPPHGGYVRRMRFVMIGPFAVIYKFPAYYVLRYRRDEILSLPVHFACFSELSRQFEGWRLGLHFWESACTIA